jgi:hypothetical protein
MLGHLPHGWLLDEVEEDLQVEVVPMSWMNVMLLLPMSLAV